jgi:hypothetical protein
MNRLSGLVLSAAVAIGSLAASGTASADWRGPRVGIWIGPGPLWWGAPYPYYYPPAVVAGPSPVYVQPSPVVQVPPPQTYWYFCRKSNTFYPYVAECPGGWETVMPQQPPPSSAPPASPAPQ